MTNSFFDPLEDDEDDFPLANRPSRTTKPREDALTLLPRVLIEQALGKAGLAKLRRTISPSALSSRRKATTGSRRSSGSCTRRVTGTRPSARRPMEHADARTPPAPRSSAACRPVATSPASPAALPTCRNRWSRRPTSRSDCPRSRRRTSRTSSGACAASA
jgi:hypothetical protein